jgi:ATP synthase protein I
MTDEQAQDPKNERRRFADEIEKKERRRRKGLNKDKASLWFGVGLFGLVGWSFAVPVVLLTMLGIWIDGRTQGAISWTLTLLFAGVVLGGLNLWYWVRGQGREIADHRRKEDEDANGS